MQDLKLL